MSRRGDRGGPAAGFKLALSRDDPVFGLPRDREPVRLGAVELGEGADAWWRGQAEIAGVPTWCRLGAGWGWSQAAAALAGLEGGSGETLLLPCRVSSVLNRNSRQFGKKYLFDEDEETCWNSDQVRRFHVPPSQVRSAFSGQGALRIPGPAVAVELDPAVTKSLS